MYVITVFVTRALLSYNKLFLCIFTFRSVSSWTTVSNTWSSIQRGQFLLHLPLLCLWWACESRHTCIQKLRKWGYTWQQIANRYNVSPSTVRRWSIASWKLI